MFRNAALLRKVSVFASVLMFAAIVIGCGSGGEDSASGHPTVKIAKPQDAVFDLALYAAVDLGYFERAGVNVEILEFEAGSNAANAYSGGAADLAVLGTEHAVNMSREGRKSVVIAQLFDKHVYALAATAASKIHDVKGLKGASVGITGFGSSTDTLLKWDLARNGMGPDDVSATAVGGVASQMAALKSDQISAGMLTDPFVSMGVAAGDLNIVTDYRVVDFPMLALQGQPKYLNEHRDVTQKVVDGLVAAINDVAGNYDIARQAYNARWAKKYKELNLSEDVVETMIRSTQGIYAEGGLLEQDLYNQLLEILDIAGVAEASAQPPYDQIVDMSFVNAHR